MCAPSAPPPPPASQLPVSPRSADCRLPFSGVLASQVRSCGGGGGVDSPRGRRGAACGAAEAVRRTWTRARGRQTTSGGPSAADPLGPTDKLRVAPRAPVSERADVAAHRPARAARRAGVGRRRRVGGRPSRGADGREGGRSASGGSVRGGGGRPGRPVRVARTAAGPRSRPEIGALRCAAVAAAAARGDVQQHA